MYILEGNIGAGKSTFLTLLSQQMPSISVGYEPLDSWEQKIHGESLLANFYIDPKRWAYAMETYTMLCRVREHLRDQRHPHARLIVERSIYSGHYCFALNDYHSGFLTPLEWSMYCEWFSFLVIGKCKPPAGFIYLRVTPEVAYERIVHRNRSAESTISLEYLKQLHDYHERFLIQKEGVLDELVSIPVLVLDGDRDFEHDKAALEALINQVKNFMDETALR